MNIGKDLNRGPNKNTEYSCRKIQPRVALSLLPPKEILKMKNYISGKRYEKNENVFHFSHGRPVYRRDVQILQQMAG